MDDFELKLTNFVKALSSGALRECGCNACVIKSVAAVARDIVEAFKQAFPDQHFDDTTYLWVMLDAVFLTMIKSGCDVDAIMEIVNRSVSDCFEIASAHDGPVGRA